jgi:membrane-associated phospholipid phosphatase
MQAIGFPIVTAALNWNYLLWFHVLFIACFVAAFQTNRTRLRQSFFYALLLAWSIGGIFLANVLSSAGPVFFERVTGDDRPYADLFHYLNSVNKQFPLTTLRLQDYLWSAYQATPSYSTISAMPSMHVTIAVLIFLAALNINRWLACATGLFAFLILVGSVQLGWHYAIDGYLGLGVALLSWALAGPIARWDLNRSAQSVTA